MSNRRIVGVNPWFQTEVSNALFKLAVATSIVLDGTTATVTSASHLMVTGDYVTYSGATGITAINNATWGPVTVTSSSVYTFPCTLTGSVTGSPVQEKLYFPPAGSWVCTLGANGQLEYNPASTLLVSGLSGNTSLGTDTTWRVLVAASTNGSFTSDCQPIISNGTTVSTACIGSIRFRENGTTATSYFSRNN
jgi:hypothetical protein